MTNRYGKIQISPGKKESKSLSASTKRKKTEKKKTPDSAPLQKSKFAKYGLIPLILLLIFAGYYILSSVFLPLFIQRNLPALFQEKTGLELEVGSAKFNPLNFSCVLSGVTINSIDQQGATDDLLNISELFIDIDFPSLLRNGLVTQSLTIDNATLTIRRYTDQKYNITPFFSKDSTQATDTFNFADLPFLYSLNNITISNSAVIFNDLSTNKVHNIENLSVSLPTLSNFSYDAGQYIQPRFSAVINGSPIELVGDTETTMLNGQKSEITKLNFTLKAFNLPLYANYLPISLPVTITKGSADGTLQISFSSAKGSGRQLTIDYMLSAANLAIESHDKTASLKSAAVILEGSIKPLNNIVELEKLLLKDPQLTLSDKVSAATIDSLLLDSQKDETINALAQQPAALSITTLIADNGKIIIDANKEKQIYSQVQLSIKNFANTQFPQQNKTNTESTFSLSGQSELELFDFSWNGKFKNSRPSGKLEIKNVPLAKVVQYLSPQNKGKSTGRAAVSGNLSISRASTSPVGVTFDKGQVLLADYSFMHNSQEWLKGKKGRLSPINVQDQTTTLGNIFLDEVAINIQRGSYPSLLTDLISSETLRITGLDISGELRILGSAKNDPSQSYSDVKIQLKDIGTQNKKDNFVFSANQGKTGTIKAKGKVSLNPVQGIVGIALKSIPVDSLGLDLHLSGYQPAPSSILSGIGNYNLEKSLFNGAVEIDNGTFKDTKNGKTFTFGKGVIGKVDYSASTRLLELTNSVFKNVNFTTKDLKVSAPGCTLTELRFKNNDVSIGEVSLPEVQVEFGNSFPEIFEPLYKKRKGSFTLDKLSLDGKILKLNENSIQQVFSKNFKLTLQELGTKTTKNTTLNFKADIEQSGSVTATGNLSVFPVKGKIDSRFENIDSTLLNRYFQKIQNLNWSGTAAGNLSFRYPDKVLSGNITLGSGSIGNNTGNFALQWSQAQIGDIQVTDLPYRIGIQSLTLEKPQAKLSTKSEHFLTTLSKEVTSLLMVNVPDGETAIKPRLNIDKVSIRNGNVAYTDGKLSPDWKADIRSLQGTMSNFNTSKTQKPVDFALNGEIDNSAFTYEGRLTDTPTGPVETFSLQQTFVPLDMYSAQLGNTFSIITQDALLDLKYQKSEQSTPAIASFDISLIQAKSEASATDLALALLENEKRKISATLFFPSSEKHLFTYLKNHFQKLIIKSNVSPYLLLDSPHSSLREKSTLSFEPGSTTINSDIKKNLADFSDLIKDHPRVKLLFNASVSRSAEKAALRQKFEEIEQDRSKQRNEQLRKQWQNNQTQKGSKPTSTAPTEPTDEITEEELELFTPQSPRPVVINDEKLIKLARLRLQSMRDYLIDNLSVPAQNIEIMEDIQLTDNIQSSQVKIKLSTVTD